MIESTRHFWRGIKGQRGLRISIIVIIIWIALALFAPILELLFGHSFTRLQPENGLLSPFSSSQDFFHLLGTDYLGRDLFIAMIRGARVAFIISFSSVAISLFLGLSVGLLIGFYGDSGIRKNIFQQIIIYLTVGLSIYYLISLLTDGLSIYNIIPLMSIITVAIGLDLICNKLPLKKYGIPFDMLMQRLFELREGVPGLFIILSLAAIISSQSIFSVALIIAILYWMTFARHARAETLRVKEEEYILSAKTSGISDFRLMFYHILPNAMPSIYVIIAFTFGAVILLESSLSFLGIGMPVEEISWGKILAGARKSPRAWWLAVFPGMAIFLVLYSFNNLADYFGQYQRRSDKM